jgi:hypothetical protein
MHVQKKDRAGAAHSKDTSAGISQQRRPKARSRFSDSSAAISSARSRSGALKLFLAKATAIATAPGTVVPLHSNQLPNWCRCSDRRLAYCCVTGMRSRLLVSLLFVISACGTNSNGTSSEDAGDGGACCPPSASPSCCMVYGGLRSKGGCPAACDGMPLPNDPGWKLTTDSDGCSVWTNPSRNGSAGSCGTVAALPDAGLDPTCPELREARITCFAGHEGDNRCGTPGLDCTYVDGASTFHMRCVGHVDDAGPDAGAGLWSCQ